MFIPLSSRRTGETILYEYAKCTEVWRRKSCYWWDVNTVRYEEA
jgi:hypothetical protein